jgi:hypothetical protein
VNRVVITKAFVADFGKLKPGQVPRAAFINSDGDVEILVSGENAPGSGYVQAAIGRTLMRGMLDVPDGVEIVNAYISPNESFAGSLVLCAAGTGLQAPEGPDVPHRLQARTLQNRRGESFTIILWPGHEQQALELYGLKP